MEGLGVPQVYTVSKGTSYCLLKSVHSLHLVNIQTRATISSHPDKWAVA